MNIDSIIREKILKTKSSEIKECFVDVVDDFFKDVVDDLAMKSYIIDDISDEEFIANKANISQAFLDTAKAMSTLLSLYISEYESIKTLQKGQKELDDYLEYLFDTAHTEKDDIERE